ncbi:MAG TPA: hypothetical protein VMW33_14050 [Ilumatobacteraceae bacterium]|nr:hypothetical protein [Ilumatobacteraceae bacterium]
MRRARRGRADLFAGAALGLDGRHRIGAMEFAEPWTARSGSRRWKKTIFPFGFG